MRICFELSLGIAISWVYFHPWSSLDCDEFCIWYHVVGFMYVYITDSIWLFVQHFTRINYKLQRYHRKKKKDDEHKHTHTQRDTNAKPGMKWFLFDVCF